MVRTGTKATSYQWRQGRVHSLTSSVIVIDDADSADTPDPAKHVPNVVVDFGEMDYQMLSLRLDNFHDGDKGDGLCWFHIDASVTVKPLTRFRKREVYHSLTRSTSGFV